MARPAKKQNLTQIAKEAGVSVFAVSCVVNNRPGVSDQTRQRIAEIIKRSGYTRNYKRSAGRTIGLVLPGAWDDWYMSAIIRGVMAYSAETDINIATIVHQPENSKSLPLSLRDHNCDAAVIAMPCRMIHDIEAVAETTDIPIILTDTRLGSNRLEKKKPKRIWGYVDNEFLPGRATNLTRASHRSWGH